MWCRTLDGGQRVNYKYDAMCRMEEEYINQRIFEVIEIPRAMELTI